MNDEAIWMMTGDDHILKIYGQETTVASMAEVNVGHNFFYAVDDADAVGQPQHRASSGMVYTHAISLGDGPNGANPVFVVNSITDDDSITAKGI